MKRGPHALLAAIGAMAMLGAPGAFAQTPAGGSTTLAAELPPAATIIARYIDVLGGEERIRSHKSLTTKARMDIPAQSISGEMLILAMAPDKMLLTIEIPSIGTVKSGFDGKVGWSTNPMMGAMLVEGAELEQLKEQADFYASLNYDKLYASMETVEETDFAEEPCYKVKLVSKSGDERFDYFSKKTGLLRGNEMTAESPMGAIDVVTTIDEYKAFDGILTPVITRQEMMMMEQVITVESVEYDNVEESVFELPGEIKALVEDDDDDEGHEHAQDDDDHDHHDDDDDDDE